MYARALMVVLIPVFLYFAACCLVLSLFGFIFQVLANGVTEIGTTLADGTASLVRGLEELSKPK